jgi:hypothetical protein
MNGSIFKRRLPSGTITWVYKFDAGRDQNGKRLYSFKSGFETKGSASEAMRKAIIEFEMTHGKITKRRGILGTVTWGYEFGDFKKAGFADRTAAEAELLKEIERRAGWLHMVARRRLPK